MFDISEVRQIRPQDLTERVCVIVSTIQTLRVTNTEGRRAYAHAEDFEPHFAHIPDSTPGLDRFKDGRIKLSFVNLMALHQPLVILDEAHKAVTTLSFEMLAALRPACIVEFTATPNAHLHHGSNVLFRASAAVVKAAELIKLPIILTEHPDWRAAIHDAIETRARLADTAKSDASYIRPLALFQAQDKGQEVTVEVLKKYLMENENIPPERIAVATGEQRELDAINLFDKACPVEFIITIEALKEGWDCSFAYVLCSVANIGSATDIEQILGRVLRMPYAKSRSNEALNRAYTHVSSPRFGEGARQLADTLIQKMGFEPDEAAAAVEQRQTVFPGFGPQGDLFYSAPVLCETLDAAPNLSGLDAEVTARVKVQPQPDGTVTVTIHGDIPDELEKRLTIATRPERREAMRAAVQRHRIIHRNSISPAARGEKFAVPRLFLYVQGKLEFVEKELILELGEWTLNNYPAELTPAEFAIREAEEIIPQMHHCTRCRGDAVGLLEADRTDEFGGCLSACASSVPAAMGRPYVAVASQEGVLVNLHLGEAASFQIWGIKDGAYKMLEERPAPRPGGGADRWWTMAETMKDCRAVLVSGIGDTPAAVLSEAGVEPVVMNGFIDMALTAIYGGGDLSGLRGRRRGVAGGCSQKKSGEGCM
ncbi:MAG: NifB/NifX family molybdenum-iron cluster-binding protein [Deltaproteobacteria bacterium]|nr:NifB/NifX family molybdenum-iron cluster-binding protein [Deltaproteobacteria bacterium]